MDTEDTLEVYRTPDFCLNGKGDRAEWSRTRWHPLRQIDTGGAGYSTRFKILYSETGVYVVLQGEDRKITAKSTEDFEDLFHADVFEVFFHPDPATPLYFEYEINALGNELVLLVPNLRGRFMGWRPWHYEDKRKVQKCVSVEGGGPVPGGAIQSWSAEIFFPFALLAPLGNVPPVRGTSWKANFCRLDYDTGTMIKWSWSPIQVSFHEFPAYKTIVFQ
jgi:hypothetical protein